MRFLASVLIIAFIAVLASGVEAIHSRAQNMQPALAPGSSPAPNAPATTPSTPAPGAPAAPKPAPANKGATGAAVPAPAPANKSSTGAAAPAPANKSSTGAAAPAPANKGATGTAPAPPKKGAAGPASAGPASAEKKEEKKDDEKVPAINLFPKLPPFEEKKIDDNKAFKLVIASVEGKNVVMRGFFPGKLGDAEVLNPLDGSKHHIPSSIGLRNPLISHNIWIKNINKHQDKPVVGLQSQVQNALNNDKFKWADEMHEQWGYEAKKDYEHLLTYRCYEVSCNGQTAVTEKLDEHDPTQYCAPYRNFRGEKLPANQKFAICASKESWEKLDTQFANPAEIVKAKAANAAKKAEEARKAAGFGNAAASSSSTGAVAATGASAATGKPAAASSTAATGKPAAAASSTGAATGKPAPASTTAAPATAPSAAAPSAAAPNGKGVGKGVQFRQKLRRALNPATEA